MKPPPLAAFNLVTTASEFFFGSAGPELDVHVAAEADAVAKAPAKVDDVQPGFGLERVIGVHADLDKILEDAIHVAAAVIDHGQAVDVALIDQRLHARLEVLPPEYRREQHSFLVGHVSPDHHAVQEAARGLDLPAQDPKLNSCSRFTKRAITSGYMPIHSIAFSLPTMRQIISWLRTRSRRRETVNRSSTSRQMAADPWQNRRRRR